MRAHIAEVFSSLQGEGPYLGVKQVFVRFAGCNLSCAYCDTPEARKAGPKCRVEAAPWKEDFTFLDNPVDREVLQGVVEKYHGIHSVALTGGEPLLHWDFIKALDVRMPLYLETNMTLPEGAAKVRGRVRYVAGDFKLRDAFPGTEDYDSIRDATVKTFKTLRSNGRRDCFCKVVVKEGADVNEVLENIEEIKDWVSSLVIQPLTPPDNRVRPLAEGVLDLQARAAELVRDVRIIPQTHKIWGIQ